jgi:hypothetical protein
VLNAQNTAFSNMDILRYRKVESWLTVFHVFLLFFHKWDTLSVVKTQLRVTCLNVKAGVCAM